MQQIETQLAMQFLSKAGGFQVIPSRYKGTYSQAQYIAIWNEPDEDIDVFPYDCIGEDSECQHFWDEEHNTNEWFYMVGKGNTTQEALQDLVYRVMIFCQKDKDKLKDMYLSTDASNKELVSTMLFGLSESDKCKALASIEPDFYQLISFINSLKNN